MILILFFLFSYFLVRSTIDYSLASQNPFAGELDVWPLGSSGFLLLFYSYLLTHFPFWLIYLIFDSLFFLPPFSSGSCSISLIFLASFFFLTIFFGFICSPPSPRTLDTRLVVELNRIIFPTHSGTKTETPLSAHTTFARSSFLCPLLPSLSRTAIHTLDASLPLPIHLLSRVLFLLLSLSFSPTYPSFRHSSPRTLFLSFPSTRSRG